MRLTEQVGRALGEVIAPLARATSQLRDARTFHPRGQVFRVRVDQLAAPEPLASLARRLEGPALARLSTALWRDGKEHKDAFGLALRFRRDPRVDAEPEEGDQDLLFATIRRPLTTPFAPLTTHVHDFLDNDYYAVSPFGSLEVPWMRLRLRSLRPPPSGSDREERLFRAVDAGAAVFHLEVKRRTRRYEPILAVQLVEPVDIDQEALRFDPYRAGRGLRPRGLVHAMRIATYRESQKGRPEKDGRPPDRAEGRPPAR